MRTSLPCVLHRKGVQVPRSALQWDCSIYLYSYRPHCCKCFCWFYIAFRGIFFFPPKSLLIACLPFNPSDCYLNLYHYQSWTNTLGDSFGCPFHIHHYTDVPIWPFLVIRQLEQKGPHSHHRTHSHTLALWYLRTELTLERWVCSWKDLDPEEPNVLFYCIFVTCHIFKYISIYNAKGIIIVKTQHVTLEPG